MEITLIDRIEHFEKLRKNWDFIYKNDSHVTIHRSWEWIRSWIESTKYEWFVLAAKKQADHSFVAFLPMGKATKRNGKIELVIGGHPLSAHKGFLCCEEDNEETISQFSKYIQNNLKWDVFLVKDVLDSRVDLFVKKFSKLKYKVKYQEQTPCPYIQLPSDWEEYIKTCLKKRERNYARNALREINDLQDLNIKLATNDNFEEQMDTFMYFWQLEWGSKSESILEQYRNLFRCALRNEVLRMVEYRDGEIVFAVVASWIDIHRKVISAFITCYNDESGNIRSPGKAADLLEVREAINAGYTIYDLGRGGEQYKYHLGAINRYNINISIHRVSLQKRIKVAIKYVLRFFHIKY